jgi:hypothetical protein
VVARTQENIVEHLTETTDFDVSFLQPPHLEIVSYDEDNGVISLDISEECKVEFIRAHKLEEFDEQVFSAFFTQVLTEGMKLLESKS